MPSIRIEMDYYTYAYLREDKTPYYIGKGTGGRIYKKGTGEIHPPKDKSRIIFLKQNLTEEEAFKHEIYMIDVFGRKDLGTGILHNRTDGGDGVSGAIRSDEYRRRLSVLHKNKIVSEETRKKMSEAHKGENNPNYGKSPSEETRKKQSVVMSCENNPNYGKSPSEETRKKQSVVMSGRKWWNDGCGNRKFVIECPGDCWILGRK